MKEESLGVLRQGDELYLIDRAGNTLAHIYKAATFPKRSRCWHIYRKDGVRVASGWASTEKRAMAICKAGASNS